MPFSFDELHDLVADFGHQKCPAIMNDPHLFHCLVDFVVALVCYVQDEQRKHDAAANLEAMRKPSLQ